jgi:hypothetical protein
MATQPLCTSRRSRSRSRVVSALAGAILIGLLPAAPAHASLGCTPEPAWAEAKPLWVAEVLALTNAHRATLGLDPLEPSTTLTAAAQWKAAHMAHLDYMEHDDRGSPARDWYQRLTDCGYTGGAGENLAHGYRSPASAFQGWLDSAGHRRNIEDPGYGVIGVGAAVNANGWPYWAQVFGTRIDHAPPTPDAPSPPASTPSPPPIPATASPAAPTNPSPPVPEPRPIEATDDSASTDEDQVLVIDVLENDDVGPETLEHMAFGNPANGSVARSGDSVIYEPDPNFNGSDAFTYSIETPSGGTASAVVEVDVVPINDEPVVVDDRVRTSRRRSAVARVLDNDFDVDDDDLVVSLRRRAFFGSVDLDESSGTISFRPGRKSAGRTVVVRYSVSDGHGGADSGRLTIEIRG